MKCPAIKCSLNPRDQSLSTALLSSTSSWPKTAANLPAINATRILAQILCQQASLRKPARNDFGVLPPGKARSNDSSKLPCAIYFKRGRMAHMKDRRSTQWCNHRLCSPASNMNSLIRFAGIQLGLYMLHPFWQFLGVDIAQVVDIEASRVQHHSNAPCIFPCACRRLHRKAPWRTMWAGWLSLRFNQDANNPPLVQESLLQKSLGQEWANL